jgi:hypothetical protein
MLAGLMIVALRVVTYQTSPIRDALNLHSSDPILVALNVVQLILLLTMVTIVLFVSRKQDNGR